MQIVFHYLFSIGLFSIYQAKVIDTSGIYVRVSGSRNFIKVYYLTKCFANIEYALSKKAFGRLENNILYSLPIYNNR